MPTKLHFSEQIISKLREAEVHLAQVIVILIRAGDSCRDKRRQ